MLVKQRKKLFEVVCYEEGEEGICSRTKVDCNGQQFVEIHKTILRKGLKKAFDADPDFGHRMAHEIL